MAAAPPMRRTKTPGVYRRGSRYVVTYRDASGKQRKESAMSYETARKRKRKRDDERDQGVLPPCATPLFQDFARQWIEGYQGGRRGIRERTRCDYRRDLEAYAFAFFSASKRLAAITPGDADRYVGWLMNPDEQEGRRLTPRTIERILTPVRCALRSAVRERLIIVNPFDDVVVPCPDEIEEDDERPKALKPAQLRRFLEVVDPDWCLFFETLAATGARWSEAIAWRKRDLDLVTPCLQVRRSLQNGRPEPPKIRLSRRDIPIAGELATRLAERVVGNGRDELIFAASNGQPLRSENVRRRQLKPAAESAGVPWIGFHAFRHTAASLLFAGGANVVGVQRFLGHHSAAFTLDTYVHLFDDAQRPVLDLSAVIGF